VIAHAAAAAVWFADGVDDTTPTRRWGAIERGAVVAAVVALIGVVIATALARVDTAAAASPTAVRPSRSALTASVRSGVGGIGVPMLCVAVLLAGVTAVLVVAGRDHHADG
jgi:hypothetical protein